MNEFVARDWMQKNCCVFDMNGTLLDDLGAMYSIVCEVFASFGKESPKLEEYRKLAGYNDYWPLYEKHGFKESEKRDADATFRKIFNSKYFVSARLFDDARITLEKLRSAGFSIAVVSNQVRKGVESKINQFELAGLIDVVVCSNDVKNAKPSAGPLLLAFNRLGTEPERGIYVGDQAADVQMARNAGVFSVAISRQGSYDTPETLAEARPDTMINNLSGVLRLLMPK